MENPIDREHLVNECGWCGAPCEKDFCSQVCTEQWIKE